MQVQGALILAAVEGLGAAGRSLMARHGILQLHPADWYAADPWLGVLQDVVQRPLNFSVVDLGMVLADRLPLVEDDVHCLDRVYASYHRQPDGLIVDVVDDDSLRVIDRSPYPNGFIYGFLLGVACRFGGWTVERVDSRTYRMVSRDNNALKGV